MAELLNYSVPAIQSLSARPVSTTAFDGVYAELKAATFARYCSRIVLATSLVSSDRTIGGLWDSRAYTVPCTIRIGSLTDNASIIDYTPLGDLNVADYAVPLLIPANTSLYVVWGGVQPSSAGKATANLALST